MSSTYIPAIDAAGIAMDWKKHGFDRFQMQRHATLGAGHCLLHAIAQAIYVEYRTQQYRGRPLSRQTMIVDLRNEIADRLSAIDPETGITYYESIGGGTIAEMGIDRYEFSLEAMAAYFRSDQPLGQEMMVVLSYMVKKSIYLLDLESQDVFVTDAGFPNPNHPAVVIIYTGGHYEVVTVWTPVLREHLAHFLPDHSFIQFLRQRIKEYKSDH